MTSAAVLLNLSSQARTPYRSALQIGGVSLGIEAPRQKDILLGPSLAPFRTGSGACDVELRIEWKRELLRTQEQPLFDSGSVWRLYDCERGFRFDFSSSTLGQQPYKRLLIDRQFRSGIVQMSERSFARCCVSSDPLDYPLDELLIAHRLTQEKGIELHGCGIVTSDGIGNLFVGHSGAGKSTTTRLWTEWQDVQILSDDRIIVRQDANNKMRMYGTPWHGEERYALPESAPLARIFILEHGRGNLLKELSSGEAVAELFARSFVPLHRHEYVDSALQFLQEVVDAVPCYRYDFEPNQAAVERVLELRD